MQQFEKDFIVECKKKLLSLKADLLNLAKAQQYELSTINKSSGDEVDLTVSEINEKMVLISHERTRFQLLEVELALGRIEKGSFGICEETQEPIEIQRLRALPFTRLSIEGAEIREMLKLKNASK